MQHNITLKKSIDFSIRIYNLSKYLKKECHEFSLSNQLLKSGTSIGANLHEASVGQSRADFISKVSISLKEAKETEYWLLILLKTKLISKQQFESINADCIELSKILSKSRKTARINKLKL